MRYHQIMGLDKSGGIHYHGVLAFGAKAQTRREARGLKQLAWTRRRCSAAAFGCVRIGHATKSRAAALASPPDTIHSTTDPNPVQWLTVKETPRRGRHLPQ